MSFSPGRVCLVKDIRITSFNAGEDIARFLVPANREVEVYNLRSYIDVSGGASAAVKLVDSVGRVLAQVGCTGRSGDVLEASETATAPVRVVASSSGGMYGGDTLLRLQNGTADISAFKGTIQIDLSYPGAK